MRILYLSIGYIPSRRANSVQVMKMCQALAHQGHDVTVVWKSNVQAEESYAGTDHEFYGVEPDFHIVKLLRPSGRGGGILYALNVARFLWHSRGHIDLVYARDVIGGYVATRCGLPTLFEAHEFPQGRGLRIIHRHLLGSRFLRRLVTNSSILRDDFAAAGWPTTADVVVAYNGADVPDGPPSSNIGVIVGRPQLGYVGNLYRGKGMEIIAAVADRLPECDFHVVGGEERDLKAWRQAGVPVNVTLHGFVPPAALPAYHRRCHIMLLPVQREVYGGSRRTDYSRWTTPLKMFEYMAAGRPIVASDLPVIREVLEHGRNALLVPPDNLEAWETAVRTLITDASLRTGLAQAAVKDFHREYTREARARRVLEGLSVSR